MRIVQLGLPLLCLLAAALLSGRLRAQGTAETWAFEPAEDDFRADAVLDLRPLNEKVAGEAGWVTADASGDFRLGNGAPARFWAVNSTVGRAWQPRPRWGRKEPDLARHARFLAKRGVNMVRLHAFVNPDPKAQSLTDINEAERQWIWKAVAAYKREGIYTTLSPYFALNARFAEAWGLPGNPQDAHSLLFFEEKLQSAYRGWLRRLLAEPNPHTGLPLGRDPALAIFQIQNEDSLLFWTVNALKGEPRSLLQAKFGAWCIAKYGGIPAALAAWQGDRLPGDDPPSGRLDFHNIYEMTQPRTGGRAARLADQLQFWAETMFRFNQSIVKYLRDDLKCGQLINAGNWKTADPVRLNDVERWTYTAGEVAAVNRYFSGQHTGQNSNWAVTRGHDFTSPSALRDPLQLPVTLKQTRGRPMLVTESGWVMPAGHVAEGPFLVSAYQCLTGVDAFYWFSTAAEQWEEPRSANGYLDSQAKWPIATPDTFGMFPAAALIWRKALLDRGTPVVHEERRLEDLWKRSPTLIGESAGFDPNRDRGNPASPALPTAASPLAFLAGPVEVVYGGDPARNRNVSAPLVDAAARTVQSVTGQILLDYGKGLCTLNGPKAQGAAAFFPEAGPIRLKDVDIEARNAYGTVTVTPLDEQPIATSTRLLVQVGTRARPTGWREAPAEIQVRDQKISGLRIEDHGRAPWRVESPVVTLTVRNAKLRSGLILDPNGYSRGAAAVTAVPGGVRLTFPRDALYVVLKD